MRNALVLLGFVLVGCQRDHSTLNVVASLPVDLKEVSGIQMNPDKNALFLIEDSGNDNFLYLFGFNNGNLVATLVAAENTDWEDLTSDKDSNLYLGDFGNNDNDRKDLCIYKINPIAKNDVIIPDYKVSFYYPEQTEFPPSKKELWYDCEAFFERNGFFYLFTKNRSKGFDGTTLIYKVPNKEGHHAAQLLGKYKTGEDYNDSAVTGAAISPDGSKFVLLSHSKVWLFEHFEGDNFLNGKITQLELHHYSQKEAVCFKDNSTLLIADEKDKKTGGRLYEVRLKSLEAKP
ncbi:hypothetical protein [Flavobacterium sedimenticola]|uniref:Uncharacterized protein n=1 Tax=Flavobacterium sedimenticola TaxID=3043286 RepID=A0ABT6XTK8_9FLAO|nr:hypothetical protein [Flavobacterium sedimenticola]MDI9258431.1 hypothetical protein [Flavobacterium sedimenticola]